MLIDRLRDPTRFGPWCKQVHVLETHISYVLLTGSFAFKIKKAVNLGFLDFRTLDARRFYCERELELNRRTAPDLYLAVVPITGTPDDPRVGGEGTPIEYAVQMREFPQAALLARRLATGRLTTADIDALADTIAAFHAAAAVADAKATFGSADEVLALAAENFTEIEPLLDTDIDRAAFERLRAWTSAQHAAHRDAFDRRRRTGFVRACHGDLHLGNIALVDGRVTPFDCIEFNEHMRWSDVMADVGFLVMDLEDRGRPDLATRFLNAYLEISGDYDGLRVLRFYVVYRAIVRAKVARMRAAQADGAARVDSLAEYRSYIDLAQRSAESTAGGMIVMHGFAGAGKSTVSQRLVEGVSAVRVRTDVERKRRRGLPPRARSDSAVASGIYSAADTEATYARVADLARTITSGGYAVVVDGTFLARRHRDRFRLLAADLGVGFLLLDCVADVPTLRAHLAARTLDGTDPSEADATVLAHQLATAEPLSDAERADAIRCESGASRPVDVVHEVSARLHLRELDAGVSRSLGQ